MKTRKVLSIVVGIPVYAVIFWAIWNSPPAVYYRAKQELFNTGLSLDRFGRNRMTVYFDALRWSGETEKASALLQHDMEMVGTEYGVYRSGDYLSIAVACAQIGAIDQTERAIRKAVEAKSSDNPRYDDLLVVKAYLNLNDTGKAIEALKKALAAVPERYAYRRYPTYGVLYYTTLAEVCARLTLFGEAQKALKAATHDASLAEDYAGIARLYSRLGNNDETERMFARANEAAKQMQADVQYSSYLKIADACADLNDREQAKAAVEKAQASYYALKEDVRKSPSLAYYEIADAYLKIQETERAKAVLDEAVKQLPESKVNHVAMATLSIKMNAPDKAKEWLAKALKALKGLDNADRAYAGVAEAYAKLAEAYAKLGDLREAYSLVRKIEDREVRIFALSRIIKAWAFYQNPALERKEAKERAK